MGQLKKNFSILIWLVSIAAFWLLLAPRQLGGCCIYIIVSGNSMEPFLQNGDLAILRQNKDYAVGDVVVYRHPKLGSVIHRIVAEKYGRYTLQGDHNDWMDTYDPSKDEIEGKLWLHIARAGKILRGFRTPIGAALLAGVIGLLLFFPEVKE